MRKPKELSAREQDFLDNLEKFRSGDHDGMVGMLANIRQHIDELSDESGLTREVMVDGKKLSMRVEVKP
jgi:hypothetical protein